MSRNSLMRRPIFVFLPKKIDTVISFFGILYSANFYATADVRFPEKLIRKILTKLRPDIVITNTEYLPLMVKIGILTDNIILYDEIDFTYIPEDDRLKFVINLDLIYILFTSGSTGEPKAVAIRHASVIDYIDWVTNKLEITDSDSLLNYGQLCYNIGASNLYCCIKSGATLHFSEGYPADFLQYIIAHKISVLNLVPSRMIYIAINHLLEHIDCSALRVIMFAGETMPARQMNYWRRCLPNCRFIFLYGLTEIAYICTYLEINREFQDDEQIPIGIPCQNTEIIVLDCENKLISTANTSGELCVRGMGLAAGYRGDVKKTKAAFVSNPLIPEIEDVVFHTGDLVHYNERHELIFDGRKDFQIKHLGYRVELGEVEIVARSIEGVTNACCVYDKKRGEIVLFYQSNTRLDKTVIRSKMKKLLPRHTIPSRLFEIEKFPYNYNEKIDRLKLAQILEEGL